jgi:hypothetical protein
MRMRIVGIVKEKESQKPLSGLIVCVYDKDILRSDLLGKTKTQSDGKFTINYDSSDFKEPMEKNPDIYLKVFFGKDAKSIGKRKIKPIYSTKDSIRYSASSSEKFYIEIPHNKLK